MLLLLWFNAVKIPILNMYRNNCNKMFTLCVCVCVILLLVHVMWLFGQENVTVAYEQPKAVG